MLVSCIRVVCFLSAVHWRSDDQNSRAPFYRLDLRRLPDQVSLRVRTNPVLIPIQPREQRPLFLVAVAVAAAVGFSPVTPERPNRRRPVSLSCLICLPPVEDPYPR
jgi:hypothetical protein